jgi:hypothetical protein
MERKRKRDAKDASLELVKVPLHDEIQTIYEYI